MGSSRGAGERENGGMKEGSQRRGGGGSDERSEKIMDMNDGEMEGSTQGGGNSCPKTWD